ncbi:MAG: FG-GAP repeat domain-containing protein [Armatimonadota bacterium]
MRRIEWEKIKIDSGAYESAGVFDVNNDGKLDIVCGAYWYEAPHWTKHKICEVRAEGEYYDDFSTIPLDVNGDGYLDFITGGWWGGTLVWRENPKGKPIEWKTHVIDKCGNIETTRAWDIDGDGEVEICPNTPGAPLRFYKLIKDKQGPRWLKVTIQKEGVQSHGLGFGDVNGDGRGDLVVSSGWWEAPADPLREEWKFHREFDLGSASVPIIVCDFNKDGLSELIVGQAHGYGLDYYTQKLENGRRIWTRHPIDPYFSQYHEIIYIDLDGDEEKEIVTGNRFRAHCGADPGETNIVGLYYFKWNGESWTKCVIDYGTAGKHSGTGIFMQVVDIDDDGRLDIVAPGKEGLFMFRNLGVEQAGVKK